MEVRNRNIGNWKLKITFRKRKVDLMINNDGCEERITSVDTLMKKRVHAISPVVGFNSLIESGKDDQSTNLWAISTSNFKRTKTRPPSELNQSLNKINSGNFSFHNHSIVSGKSKKRYKNGAKGYDRKSTANQLASFENQLSANNQTINTQHSINNGKV